MRSAFTAPGADERSNPSHAQHGCREHRGQVVWGEYPTAAVWTLNAPCTPCIDDVRYHPSLPGGLAVPRLGRTSLPIPLPLHLAMGLVSRGPGAGMRLREAELPGRFSWGY